MAFWQFAAMKYRSLVLAARISLLNRRVGIKIQEPQYWAKTVKVLMTPDGFGVGGTVDIAPGARFSEGVIVAPYGGAISIGRNFYAGPYSVLYGHGGLHIGNDVLIAPHCVIVAANHGFSESGVAIRAQKPTKRGIIIEDDVWVGSGVRILDGVKIGCGCVIGAGSVVTNSIPERSIAVGIPARVIGARD